MANKYIFHRHRVKISESDLYKTYKIFFGTLVSQSRLRIINLLRGGKKNVCEIVGDLDMNQTTVSHDLARLKRCGFVKSERNHRFIYYVLNHGTIKPLMSIIDKHMSEYCIHILQSMKERGENNGK